MADDFIVTLQTINQDSRLPAALRGGPLMDFMTRRFELLGRELPTETHPTAKVVARVDAGRWLADCLTCNSAEPIDFDDLRFVCLTCFNEAHEGQWLRVEAPAAPARELIETALLALPVARRFWRP